MRFTEILKVNQKEATESILGPSGTSYQSVKNQYFNVYSKKDTKFFSKNKNNNFEIRTSVTKAPVTKAPVIEETKPVETEVKTEVKKETKSDPFANGDDTE